MKILWDFDGTLFDTYPGYAKMIKKVFKGEQSPEDIYSLLKVSFGHAFKELALSKEQIDEVHKLERALEPKDFMPFPGVKKVLESAELNVIMTHKYREGVVDILKANNMDQYFTEIVALDDGYPRKPDPESYWYLHNKYGIDLVVGDRELDIIPGKSIGAKTCLFQSKAPGADYYINDYEEFFDVVQLNR